MTTVQYSTKLTPRQIKELKTISEKTHIPQAVLVREAVNVLIEELNSKDISKDFMGLVRKRVKEEKSLLKRLASS
ncbi:MAG: ribbon-helix-helix domain-containing protein [Candidatus Omnitrophota bacterium]|jgi:predicted DNA-binding protein